MLISDQLIRELVESNPSYAFVLHSWGVNFYEVEHLTLAEVCKYKGINPEVILKNLIEFSLPTQAPDFKILRQMPIIWLVEYLKHSHQLFVQLRLPYIAGLIQGTDIQKTGQAQLIADLKLMFPLFAEDFIHHVHEEEEKLFAYIGLLDEALNKASHLGKLYKLLQQHSIREFALAHDTHDDEMHGIRQITHNYQLSRSHSLHLKIIFKELQSFEQELKSHAFIENDILFPKALLLETQVKQWLEAQKVFN